MKKIIGLVSLAVVFTLFSCNNQPAETKKEVIVVPAAPVEKKEPVVVKEKVIVEDKPSTSIILDKKGVKVETKKVKVDINPN